MSKKPTVNLKASKEEKDLIQMIVRRAIKLARETKAEVDPISLALDITATHLNGNPLALRALLYGPEFAFTHDVMGIMRHLDRGTGKLMDHFSPRYSVRS